MAKLIPTQNCGSFADGLAPHGDHWEGTTWDERGLGLADIRLPNGDQYGLLRSLRVYGNGKVGVPAQHYYWVVKNGVPGYTSYPSVRGAMEAIAKRMERALA